MKHLDADDLYAEQVRQARRQSPGEKLAAGIELFGLACEFMKAGIRLQHPEADEDRVLELLRQRLALARRLEEGYATDS